MFGCAASIWWTGANWFESIKQVCLYLVQFSRLTDLARSHTEWSVLDTHGLMTSFMLDMRPVVTLWRPRYFSKSYCASWRRHAAIAESQQDWSLLVWDCSDKRTVWFMGKVFSWPILPLFASCACLVALAISALTSQNLKILKLKSNSNAYQDQQPWFAPAFRQWSFRRRQYSPPRQQLALSAVQ